MMYCHRYANIPRHGTLLRDNGMDNCLTATASQPVPAGATIKLALLEAVDYGLLALGEIARATVYERIEKSYEVKREEIPDKLDTFHRALQELLGKGAGIVKRLIVKNLYSRLHLEFTEHEDWTLADYVHYANKARRRWLE